jgi:hypothetical protein
MRKTPLQPFALLGLLAALGAAALSASTPATGATKPSRTRARVTHEAAARSESKPPTTAAADSTTGRTGGATTAAPDSGYTMPGGQEGTVFKSLTVEGEDRVHFEFERPELTLDLDPHQAPGLDPGSASDVLTRSGPDLLRPFAALSATTTSACVARPWLSEFVQGPVARFRPQVTGVAHWKLTIANAKGEAVATLEGQGQPPHEILWDGRAKDGSSVTPEMTYSYVFEAKDRAGNKRNFLGEGFRVSAYRLDGAGGPRLVFAAHRLAWPAIGSDGAPARDATPPILLEAATCLNQAARPERPVEVAVTARTHDQAQALATQVVRLLAPNLVGDPARVAGKAVVEPDAPEGGTVAIAYR